jgi:uncharacterized membrane protein YeaQ/YmgE (transglycosylase-associated protein family)
MLGTIIWAIVIGAIVGALGRLLLPGRQNIGIWLTLGVGIVAALLGSLVAQLFGVATTPGFDWIEFLFQLAFAVIGVALVVRLRTGRTGRTGRA